VADDGRVAIDEVALSALLVDFDRDEARAIVDVLRAESIALDAAAAVADADALGRVADVAHRLRNTCAMLGATGVAATCADVERAGRDGDVAAVRSAIAGLPARAERSARLLLARLGAPSAER
jgi:HPt (histidine-containing phosphotransfer) domain-containing protein